MMDVDEGSTAYLTVKFYDKDGELEAPSSVSYRIDCLTNNQEIRDDTSLIPASSIEITLKPSDNVIIKNMTFERRLVTVKAAYGIDDAINAEYKYNVKNLKKV